MRDEPEHDPEFDPEDHETRPKKTGEWHPDDESKTPEEIANEEMADEHDRLEWLEKQHEEEVAEQDKVTKPPEELEGGS